MKTLGTCAAVAAFVAACGSDVSLGAPDGRDAGVSPGAAKGEGDLGTGGTGAAACSAVARSPIVRVEGRYLGTVHDLAADATHVYYVASPRDDAPDRLERVPLAGGARELLAERKSVYGLALVGDDVVFAATRDDDGDRSGWATAYRVPKRGGALRVVAGPQDNPVSCCGVDPRGGATFGNWNGGVESPAPDIVRIDADGRRTVVATDLPGVSDVVTDGVTVLSSFALAEQLAPVAKPPRFEIWSTPAAGGPSRRIHGPVDDHGSSLLVDGGYVFFGSVQGIERLPIGGGDAEIVRHEPMDQPWRVRADETYLYWLARGTGGTFQSPSLRRAPKAGGGVVETLEEDVYNMHEYALGPCEVVFTTREDGADVLYRRAR